MDSVCTVYAAGPQHYSPDFPISAVTWMEDLGREGSYWWEILATPATSTCNCPSYKKKERKNLHIFTYKSKYLRDLTCTLGLLATKIRLPKHKHSDRQYDNVQSDEQAGSIYSVDTLKRRMTHIHGRHSSMSLIWSRYSEKQDIWMLLLKVLNLIFAE